MQEIQLHYNTYTHGEITLLKFITLLQYIAHMRFNFTTVYKEGDDSITMYIECLNLFLLCINFVSIRNAVVPLYS